jgi:uncharacterized protein (DUF952 family)
MSGGHIHHLAPASRYRAGEAYLPAQFAADGFIHCTREPEVLLEVANAYYRDAPGDFVVLVIDPEQVLAEVRYEPPSPPSAGGAQAGRLFPHIYGPLNPEAVVAVRPALRAPDGTFLSF